jgi:geranylgeranyl diphosphate synthase, type II
MTQRLQSAPGRVANPGNRGSAATPRDTLGAYLEECRKLVLDEIASITPRTRYGHRLYELMLEYPLRGGKALRPALCIATCRALGSHVEAVLRSAAVLELYHNAFLIHDDVEDGSELRRAEATLHRKYGVPIAVNVGDGMLALSMSPLLDNMEIIGVGRALRVLQVIARMARESAEGQMMELDWIRGEVWTIRDQDYVRMVYKKTTWYTFIAPVTIGAIAARATGDHLRILVKFATVLGIAFQIQDDVLNLVADETRYGKEIDGDLWEGKHTLILIHAMRNATESERREAARILRKPRPPSINARSSDSDELRAVARSLRKEGLLAKEGYTRLCAALEGHDRKGEYKTESDVEFLRNLVEHHGGIAYASSVAERHIDTASRCFRKITAQLPHSAHLNFLSELVEFVIRRTH